MKTFSIQYLRPDGWWEAGRGWDTREEAETDGKNHDWGNTKWRVVEIDAALPKVEALIDENDP